MECVLHHYDGGAAGVFAGDLDGVLNGFGAGVDQYALLGKIARSVFVELLAHLDVVGVRGGGEVGVGELGHFLLHGRDDFRRTVADTGHGDAGGKVDEAVAVHVGDGGAACGFGEHRHALADAGADIAVMLLLQRLRLRARNGGDDLACYLWD